MASSSKQIEADAAGGLIQPTEVNVEEEGLFGLPSGIETFIGREKELKKLETLLIYGNKVVIHGNDGCGRSELAIQFARKYLKEGRIKKTYWVNAAKPDELRMFFKFLIHNYEESTGKKCLVIFDNGNYFNVIKFELPDQYLSIIIEDICYYDDIAILDLDPLGLNSAVDLYKTYLEDYYKIEDHDLYAKIAEYANCSPLHLQISAAYIRQAFKRDGKYCPSKYLEELEQNKRKRVSLHTIIKTSINKILEMDFHRPYLFYTLYVCSYLAPEVINYELLLNILTNIEEFNCDESMLKAVLSLLDEYVLITLSSDTIRIHRYVQEILRRQDTDYYPEYQNKSYKACLEHLIKYNKDSKRNAGPIFSCLKYVDENQYTFHIFYETHKKITLNLSNDALLEQVLKYLIMYGCEYSITAILKDLGNDAGQYINKFHLLHQAAQYGQFTILRRLIAFGGDVNYKNENLDTPLHLASSEWNFTALRMLIFCGADIDARNKHGNTPLFEFFRGVIIRKSINIDEVFDTLSLFYHHLSYTEVNIYGETILHMASGSFQAALVELLITRFKFDPNVQSYAGATPLHALISKLTEIDINYKTLRICETIKQLLLNGASLDIKDSNGKTPVEIARSYNKYPVEIFFILENRYIKEITKVFNGFSDRINELDNNFKFNLIHYAIANNQLNVVKLLLQYFGVNIMKETNNFGETLLHGASGSLQTSLVELLITKYKIDPNVQSYAGATPLHTLISKLTEDDINKKLLKICETIMQLLLNGASLDADDDLGRTPKTMLKNVKNKPNNRILSFLLLKDTDLEEMKQVFAEFGDKTNEFIENNNLLHCAIACNNLKVLSLLLTYNVNVNSKDQKHRTPLHLASFHWDTEAIKLLLQHKADLKVRNHQSRNAVHFFFRGGVKAKDTTWDKMSEILQLLQPEDESSSTQT